MKILNKLIGFDVRRPDDRPIGPERPVTAEPFRPSGPGARPWLSFDPYVNPSVFGHVEELEFAHVKGYEYMQYYRTNRIMIPGGVNYGFDSFLLWDDARDMMVNYPRGESAAAWIDLTEQGIQLPPGEDLEILTTRSIHPDSLSEDWPLVGYDIVCAYFISALAGYDHSVSSPEFIESVRPYINPFGLISAEATPMDLAALVRAADNEIKEDPFFVIALFLLWDNSGRIAQGLGLINNKP